MKKEKGLTHRPTTGGFIGILILILIALILLKYFLNWSIFDAANTPQGQETISYAKNIILTTWGYIQAPLVFIWSKILWPIFEFIWNALQAIVAWRRG